MLENCTRADLTIKEGRGGDNERPRVLTRGNLETMDASARPWALPQ